MARLLDPEFRSKIVAAVPAAVEAGESVRSIAARFGVSASTISNIAREVNVQPSARSATKKATAARVADLAARRAVVSERFLAAAERALDRIEEPAVIYNFGGKDNTYNEKAVERPPTGDQRNLAIIAATMFDKHKVADQYDASLSAAAAVDDWLGHMMGRDAT